MTYIIVLVLALSAPVYAQTKPTPQHVAQEVTVKKPRWYKRALRLPLYVPAALLRVTKLNAAGNFYEDGGYWPR